MTPVDAVTRLFAKMPVVGLLRTATPTGHVVPTKHTGEPGRSHDGVGFAISSPMRKHTTPDDNSNGLQLDPDDWKTGDEPMTDAQRSYLETLCRDVGEEFDDSLSKADASKRIDELRARSPRLAEQ